MAVISRACQIFDVDKPSFYEKIGGFSHGLAKFSVKRGEVHGG